MRERLVVACVYTVGGVYTAEYVRKFGAGVRKWAGRDVELLCLTDSEEKFPDFHVFYVEEANLRGWWAKMLLFSPIWRISGKIVYFDLDTVFCGPLGPIFDVQADFAICRNFQPTNSRVCAYSSAAMVISDGWGGPVWAEFWKNKGYYTSGHGAVYGDQWAIEKILPACPILQDMLPTGFFAHKRVFTRQGPPPGASVAVFGGRVKPHNSDLPWVKELW